MTMAKRHWSRTTADSRMVSVRVPKDLMDDLGKYMGYTGRCMTEVMLTALRDYLDNHSPMEDTMEQEGGRD